VILPEPTATRSCCIMWRVFFQVDDDVICRVHRLQHSDELRLRQATIPIGFSFLRPRECYSCHEFTNCDILSLHEHARRSIPNARARFVAAVGEQTQISDNILDSPQVASSCRRTQNGDRDVALRIPATYFARQNSRLPTEDWKTITLRLQRESVKLYSHDY